MRGTDLVLAWAEVATPRIERAAVSAATLQARFDEANELGLDWIELGSACVRRVDVALPGGPLWYVGFALPSALAWYGDRIPPQKFDVAVDALVFWARRCAANSEGIAPSVGMRRVRTVCNALNRLRRLNVELTDAAFVRCVHRPQPRFVRHFRVSLRREACVRAATRLIAEGFPPPHSDAVVEAIQLTF